MQLGWFKRAGKEALHGSEISSCLIRLACSSRKWMSDTDPQYLSIYFQYSELPMSLSL